ncbi:MAG: hypothetical protein MHMPM18_002476 [Marteilia pararefringens]
MTGDFLLQLLATCGINYRSIQFLENALAVRYNDNKSVRRRFSDPFRLPHIQHFINVIREVLKAPQKFSVKIKPKEAINKFNLVKENYVYLNISSLTASFALNHFEKCHSLITFQQTMEPDSYSHIFDDANFSFRRCLLDKSQKKNISYKDSAFATICCLNDYSLSNFSSYNESLIKMGKSLCEIVEAVPNGIIIVFPSYRAMNLAILAWQESNVLSEFKRFKNIVDFDLSEQSAFQLEKFLNLYYRSMYWRNVLSPKSSVNGSLLMTVYGSKLLNQIDMGNNNCHTLIFAGLPTHVSDDSYESLKINYFNSLCDEREQDKAYKWLVSSKMLTINHIIERNIQTTTSNPKNIIVYDLSGRGNPLRYQKILTNLLDFKIYDTKSLLKNLSKFKEEFVPSIPKELQHTPITNREETFEIISTSNQINKPFLSTMRGSAADNNQKTYSMPDDYDKIFC